ncbi:tetratricopeptide repeat protein [Archangium sp.]|uniref:tetratricopeptide repeat protein n=1 Tax=Archangium sp. TaxID=1872627 RepID=UPI002D71AAA1|nr:tetratricopeptide repeat protein [Archangium sp.]HYO52012.1 tetratricopeptide repeat protein [Archangium sp.]
MINPRQDVHVVIDATNSTIGPGALVINDGGSLPLEWKRPQEIPRHLIEEGLGRNEQLADLHARLPMTPGAPPIGGGTSVAVRGPPGMGKSTLAALYAAHFQTKYPGGVLWLTFGPELHGLESVSPFLNRIATYAYRTDAQAQALLAGKQFSPEVVRSLLSGHGPLLLIADDLCDRAILEPLCRALPPESHLLITTRDARVARQSGAKLELDVLSETDALECVRRGLPRMREAQQQQLLKAVGRHPLALKIALGDLAARGNDEWAECMGRIARMVAEGQGFGHLPLMEESERESRVEATLRHSYEAMGPESQRRFRALGCMAQEADFSTETAAAIWEDSEAQAREHLDALVARALLKRQPDGRWRQHSILGTYALNLQKPEERQVLSQAHASHYLMVTRTCYELEPRDYNRLEREFRQIAHGFAWAQQHNPKMANTLAFLCEDFLRIRGHINPLERANTLKSLGDLELHLGNLDTARRYYDEALPLFEAEQSCQGTANILKSLGHLERHLGNLDAARRHYDAVLPLFEAIQDRLGTANTLRSLGDLEYRLGDLDAARRHYDAALPLFDTVQDRLGTANTLRSLGDLVFHLGDIHAARDHYANASRLYEAEQEPIGQLNTNLGQARLERGLGNMTQAEQLYRQVLGQAEKLSGLTNHPVTREIRAEYEEMLLEHNKEPSRPT